MMLTPPRRRGRAASRTEAITPRTRRAFRSNLEALEGRQLLAQASPMVLPSPTGLATVQVSPPAPAPNSGPTSPGGTLFNNPPANDLPPSPPGAPAVAYAQFEPLTGRILLTFAADPYGYDPAVLTNPANYRFSLVQAFEKQPTKSASRPRADIVLPPPYVVTGVTLTTPATPGTSPSVVVSINNNEPLRFGIYEFTVHSAGLVDLDGRSLNGQFSGTFPTGNDQGPNDFSTYLAEVNSTVLPALPTVRNTASGPSPITPSYVFLPSTRLFRVIYTSATPGKFMLAGGNKITLKPRAFQYFPGSYRLPKLDVSAVPGSKVHSKS